MAVYLSRTFAQQVLIEVTEHTDTSVIDAIRQGSYSAFEKVFNTYYAPLSRFAMGYVGDQDQSEEVVQQVFFHYWEKREELDIKTSIKAYLYQSVRNRCLNTLKHEQVRQRTQHELLRDEEPSEEHVFEGLELQERIDLTISEMPPERQRIFRMSRFEELKYREIAEKLSISVKTVENQMGKALKFMREQLSDLLPTIFWLLIIFFSNE